MMNSHLKGGEKKELQEKTGRDADREKCQHGIEKYVKLEEVQVESERGKLQKACMKHSNKGLMKGGQFVDDIEGGEADEKMPCHRSL